MGYSASSGGLPGFDLVDDRVGDRGNQGRGDLGAVHFLQVALNLPHRHAAGVQRQDLVVEAASSGSGAWGSVAARSCQWRSRGISIGSSPNSPLRVFLLSPVAGVAGGIGHRFDSCHGQGVRSSRLQAPAPPGLLVSCLSRPFSPIRSSGFLVVGQQAVQQLGAYGFILQSSLLQQDGSFLPNDRLHKNSYTLFFFGRRGWFFLRRSLIDGDCKHPQISATHY